MSDKLIDLMRVLRPRNGVCRVTMSGSTTWMETWEPGKAWKKITADSDAIKAAQAHKTKGSR